MAMTKASPATPITPIATPATWLLLTVLALTAGCADLRGGSMAAPSVVRGSPQGPAILPNLPQEQPPKEEVLPLPGKTQPQPQPAQARLGFSKADPGKVVPINLDAVLRLAEAQNGQTGIAREKLREAYAKLDLAGKAWLPDLWVGASWYRHEGGIANFQGDLVHSSYGSLFGGAEINGRFDLREAVYQKVDAERRIWQQRAEVAKLTNEALLEASNTYVDLLSARAAEAIATQNLAHLEELLKQSSQLAKTLPAAEVEVSRVQAEALAQQQLIRKFRESSLAATAKLIYLLGLDPQSELAVMDRHLLAFQLVNADVPTDDLVAQAMQKGPGIREMEGLLQTINAALEKSQGIGQYLPVFDVRVAEGAFGTGSGASSTWDNRADLGLQVRWNLTEWCTKRERDRIACSKIAQANATYGDLRAKLTMGVQESREAALSGRDQLDLGKLQVKAAAEAFDRTKKRFDQAVNPKDRAPSEVLLSIRAMTAANLAYLMAIREFDKAQLRLAILTGAAGSRGE